MRDARHRALLRPRIEIMVRLLERYPEHSMAMAEMVDTSTVVPEVLRLMDRARPDRRHTPTDLLVLTGNGVRSGEFTSAASDKMRPAVVRLLRLFRIGLSQYHQADSKNFYDLLLGTVAGIGAGRKLSLDTLEKVGFKSVRIRQGGAEDASAAWLFPRGTEIPPITPLTGHELEAIRFGLAGDGGVVNLQDWNYEIGLQRARYTELRSRKDKSIGRVEIDILARLLKRCPQFSYAHGDNYYIQECLELMNSARPERAHTPRDLAVLTGNEISIGYTWSEGRKMQPSARRLTRLIIEGLRQPDQLARRNFYNALVSTAFGVAEGYGIPPDILGQTGFKGIRARKAVDRSESGRPPAL